VVPAAVHVIRRLEATATNTNVDDALLFSQVDRERIAPGIRRDAPVKHRDYRQGRAMRNPTVTLRMGGGHADMPVRPEPRLSGDVM